MKPSWTEHCPACTAWMGAQWERTRQSAHKHQWWYLDVMWTSASLNKEMERQRSWDTGPGPQKHAAVGSGFTAVQSGSTAHAKTTPKAQNLSKAQEDFLFFSPNPTHAHDFADGPWFSCLHLCTCCLFARWPSSSTWWIPTHLPFPTL